MSGRYLAAQAAPGAPHDRRDRRPQLRPVPDDARARPSALLREPVPDPGEDRGEPRAWGLDKPLIPDQLVAYIASTLTGRPRLLDQVPRPAGDRGHRRALLADDPAHRLRGGDRDRRRPVARGPVRLAPGRHRSTGSATALSLVLYSMPYFVIGMPLIIIFAAGLGWFPTSGMTTPGGDKTPVEALFDFGRHLVLPLTAVALGPDRRRTRSSCARRSSRPGPRTTSRPPGRRACPTAGSCARTPSRTRCCRW